MPPFVWVLVVIVVIAALAVGAAAVLRRRMRDADIYVHRTKFGLALIMNVADDDDDPVRVLNVGGMFQSATYLDDRWCELVFKYYQLYDHMFDAGIPVNKALMIGGGGYAYPRYFISHFPDAAMDVVEVDPKITLLAQRYFFLDRLIVEYETEENGRLGLITADGRAYLDKRAQGVAAGEAGAYDVILNDSFSGKTPVASLATLEAARSIHDSLTEGGIYMTNVVSALSGEQARFIKAVVATLGQVFRHVYVIPCGADEFADRDNNMVVATDGDYAFKGALKLKTGPDDPVLTDDGDPKRLVAELTR